MKKQIFKFMAVMLIMTSCAGEEIPLRQMADDVMAEGNIISEVSAVSISNDFLGKEFGTRASLEAPTVTYVVDDSKTRSSLLPDTLAYVVNYPNNGGWTIISRDNRINPLLAYSDKGNFSEDNEIANAVFIERIKYYMAEHCVGNTIYNGSDVLDACVSVEPMVTITLNQRAPYNKYVEEEHPGCPVGCVAVATALVMTHSEATMAYHKKGYHLTNIRKAIQKGDKVSDIVLGAGDIAHSLADEANSVNIAVPIPTGPYTYIDAVYAVAKILYYIGLDVNMSYNPYGSGAQSINAYNLLVNEGFNVVTGYEQYNLEEIANYLSDNCIVYMRGDGHAWVADGCRYCMDITGNEKVDIYLHLDWGWGGECNGYFTGNVFMTSSGPFQGRNYFAVKRSVTE